MADSLILKGVKDVRKHTGDEMVLTIPKRGGDTHQLKRWWQKGVSTVYCSCSVFDVTTDGGLVKLAIASGKGESSTVRIDHDGSGKFTFSHINELERAALFTDDFQLIEHYIFPAIAGGSIITVTPAGAPDLPAPAPEPDTTISDIDIVGVPSPEVGTPEDYVVSVLSSDDPGPYTYNWSASNGTITAGQDAVRATVDWAFGSGVLQCTVGSSSDTFDGNVVTESFGVTASYPVPDVSVAVTVADTGNGNKYQIDGVEQDSIVANAGETIFFNLSDGSLSGHPFKIYTDSSKVTEVTVGIISVINGLYFTPPIAGSFSYQCSAHAGMGGDITVS